MVQFYGYNNGRAIAVNNRKNLLLAFKICLSPAIILSILCIILYPLALFVIWIIPSMLLAFAMLVMLFQKYDEKVFLEGQKKKHFFVIENGMVFKNGKEIKKIEKISLYKYKKEMLIVFNRNNFYLIPNDAYIIGSREELIKEAANLYK